MWKCHQNNWIWFKDFSQPWKQAWVSDEMQNVRGVCASAKHSKTHTKAQLCAHVLHINVRFLSVRCWNTVATNFFNYFDFAFKVSCCCCCFCSLSYCLGLCYYFTDQPREESQLKSMSNFEFCWETCVEVVQDNDQWAFIFKFWPYLTDSINSENASCRTLMLQFWLGCFLTLQCAEEYLMSTF